MGATIRYSEKQIAMEDIDIKKTVSFKNRHGKEILISRTGLNEFRMRGIDTFFMRTSTTDDGKLIMFDPSGGPYMTAEHNDSPGIDMGFFDIEWEGLRVESMTWGEISGEVILKCYSEKPVDWVEVK